MRGIYLIALLLLVVGCGPQKPSASNEFCYNGVVYVVFSFAGIMKGISAKLKPNGSLVACGNLKEVK